jgi:hypothetical protein
MRKLPVEGLSHNSLFFDEDEVSEVEIRDELLVTADSFFINYRLSSRNP